MSDVPQYESTMKCLYILWISMNGIPQCETSLAGQPLPPPHPTPSHPHLSWLPDNITKRMAGCWADFSHWRMVFADGAEEHCADWLVVCWQCRRTSCRMAGCLLTVQNNIMQNGWLFADSAEEHHAEWLVVELILATDQRRLLTVHKNIMRDGWLLNWF